MFYKNVKNVKSFQFWAKFPAGQIPIKIFVVPRKLIAAELFTEINLVLVQFENTLALTNFTSLLHLL